MEHVFTKINGENYSFQVNAVFDENSIELTFLQDANAWTASVTEEDLNELSQQHHLNADNYYKNLMEYIKSAPPDVILTLTNDEFVIHRTLENKLKVKYFVKKLAKANYVTCVEKMLSNFYTENMSILNRLNTVEEERNKIDKYKTEYELKLKEFIEKKKADDEELYGNFVLVLNEKKRRIQHLTELLEAFKGGRPTVNPVNETRKRAKRKAAESSPKIQKRETISESECSESYDTDEEKSPPHSFDNVENYGACTSKESYNFLKDDSPRTHVLPKRTKKNKTAANDIVAPPAPSPSCQENSIETDAQKAEDDSPTVNFSTQELLDMI